MPYPKILRTVSQMVARVVVGPEICRNPEWNEAIIDYAQNVLFAMVGSYELHNIELLGLTQYYRLI
jgi:hypothetical protein